MSVRLELHGLRLRRLLEEAEDGVVLLTEDGELHFALIPAGGRPGDDLPPPGPERTSWLRRAEGRARRLLSPAAEQDRLCEGWATFRLGAERPTLAEMLDATRQDTAVFLTDAGRLRYVLVRFHSPQPRAVGEGVRAAPPQRERGRDSVREDEPPRRPGGDVRAGPDRPPDAGMSGGEWVLYPVLFFFIPAANVLVSSVLYYAWRGTHPRRANQINLLGFGVFGVHVVLGALIGVCVAAFDLAATPAPVQPGTNNALGGPGRVPDPGGGPLPGKGLLAYWSFDEGRGAVAADGVGNRSPAALYGVRWTQGKRGMAAQFDGVSAWCDLGNSAALNFAAGDDITVGLWVKTDDGDGTVLMLRRKEDGGSGVCLSVESGRLVGIIREDGGELLGPAQVWGPRIDDDRWHHVLMTRSARADQVTLYLDGSRQESKPARPLGAGGPVTTNLRALGCERYWLMNRQFNADKQHLRCCIDEVCVYNRLLNAAEFEALLAAGPPPGGR